jgi:periplasmic divalent cation tolerance protein
MPTGALVVFTTAGSEEQAEAIARSLVEAELAACVNIVSGVRSIYRWKGTVSSDGEHLLIVKTTADRFEAVRTRIREVHTYELPEIIALSIEHADSQVLDWIRDSVAPPEGA